MKDKVEGEGDPIPRRRRSRVGYAKPNWDGVSNVHSTTPGVQSDSSLSSTDYWIQYFNSQPEDYTNLIFITRVIKNPVLLWLVVYLRQKRCASLHNSRFMETKTTMKNDKSLR